MDEAKRYKVDKLLDELIPVAKTEQKAGLSLDLRLYLRLKDNGEHEWAEVAFIDRTTGKLLHTGDRTLPLDGRDAVKWFMERIIDVGFEQIDPEDHRDG